MKPDLSCCRSVFDRDPILYLDMTEPVRRGTGDVLYASAKGALVAVRTKGTDGTIYTLFAEDEDTADLLCGLIPPHPAYVTVHESLSFSALRTHFGYTEMNPCWQVAYLEEAPISLPVSKFQIRPLTCEYLPQVLAHYRLTSDDYVAGILADGDLFGAFDGPTLSGFVGLHEEGTIGLLEVLPEYRRQGAATLLQTYLTNRELARGHIPYGQVFDGNEPSLLLQASLGYRCSHSPMYWPEF